MTTNPIEPRPTPAEPVEELAAERVPRADASRPPARLGPFPLAWVVALLADFFQIVAFPFFVAGGASPVNDVLDVVVAAVLIKLMGWHWAFLPSLIAELIPGLDLVPTWTAAVFIASRAPRGNKGAAAR